MDKQNPAEVEDFTDGAGMTSGEKKDRDINTGNKKPKARARTGRLTFVYDCGELAEAPLKAP